MQSDEIRLVTKLPEDHARAGLMIHELIREGKDPNVFCAEFGITKEEAQGLVMLFMDAQLKWVQENIETILNLFQEDWYKATDFCRQNIIGSRIVDARAMKIVKDGFEQKGWDWKATHEKRAIVPKE